MTGQRNEITVPGKHGARKKLARMLGESKRPSRRERYRAAHGLPPLAPSAYVLPTSYRPSRNAPDPTRKAGPLHHETNVPHAFQEHTPETCWSCQSERRRLPNVCPQCTAPLLPGTIHQPFCPRDKRASSVLKRRSQKRNPYGQPYASMS